MKLFSRFLLCLTIVGISFGAVSVSAKDNYIEGVVLKGENAQSILTQYMTIGDFYRLFNSTKKVYDLSRIRQDYVYALVTSDTGMLKAFSYQISRSRKVVVLNKDGKYSATIKPVDYDIIPDDVKDTIESPDQKSDDTLGKQNFPEKINSVAVENKNSEKKPEENRSGDFSGSTQKNTLSGASKDKEKEELPVNIEEIRFERTSSEEDNKSDSENGNKDGDDDDKSAFDAPIKIEGEVKKGEFAQDIFKDCMSAKEFQKLYTETKKVYNLSYLNIGNEYILEYREQSGFESFRYIINSNKHLYITKEKSKNNTYKYSAKIVPVALDIRLAMIKGTIKSSLFSAVSEQGENPELVAMLADIFGSEINFIRDIRSGDTFQVVVEKYYKKGDFVRYGRVLGARFSNRGTVYEGYRFPHDGGGAEHYYNAKGENLSKKLLKAPLKFSRISSRYTTARKHPVFKDVRTHLGIDYAAPSGTPINAVGDGRILKVGWGTGFGKMIVIKHAGGMESQYAHLSRYAKGLKSGQYVRQGQCIGYVGKTGWATGPHLDFRIRKNGRYVNPEKIVSTRSDPISSKEMKRFKEQRAFVQKVFDGKFNMSEYKSGMLYLKKNH